MVQGWESTVPEADVGTLKSKGVSCAVGCGGGVPGGGGGADQATAVNSGPGTARRGGGAVYPAAEVDAGPGGSVVVMTTGSQIASQHSVKQPWQFYSKALELWDCN